MKKITALLFALLTIVGCTDAADFEAATLEFQAAVDARDVEGVVAHYTENARLMPPGMETLTGHGSVRASFRNMYEAGMKLQLEGADINVFGNHATRVGRYRILVGGEVTEVGKFIETWYRGQDDVWRMSNDIWNRDNPRTSHGEECDETGHSDEADGDEAAAP